MLFAVPLLAVCELLYRVVWCASLSDARCALFVVRCLLCVVWCLLPARCTVLCVARWCPLFVVCLLWFVVFV